jgi:hypothetical protein
MTPEQGKRGPGRPGKSPGLVMEKPRTKCLNLDCCNAAASRGLCISCREVAQDLVKSGKTTWEKLEALDRAKPPARSMRATRARREAFFLLGNPDEGGPPGE